jgi:chemotaxis regulatin CheY-phosphate phosphatase CheZ
MDYKANMENIFQKLGDLKSFFIYGQKLVPILQKIIDFMRDTVPLLENVNRSIEDSTNKMPKAAIQLHSVTNATEIATTEILDIVDQISLDINSMQTKLESIKLKLGQDEDVVSLLQIVGKIQEGVINITLSLQVQDITSQQLTSVNHMIQSVQLKLSSLLSDINNKESKEYVEAESSLPQENSFNADARYEKNGASQKLADSLVAQTSGNTSQAEIDKLFSKP